MNLIVLGPQGSGKGTQSKLLAQKFGLENLAMGNILRHLAKAETSLGEKIHQAINVKKELVSDNILKEVLRLEINSLPEEKGIVFDGVPRNIERAHYLEEMLLGFGRKINKLIFINIPEKESQKRISKRWVCEKCKATLIMGEDVQSPEDKCPICEGRIMQRLDDTPEGVRKRLGIFQKETMPVIEYFRAKNLVVEVDGQKPVEEVFQEIISKL